MPDTVLEAPARRAKTDPARFEVVKNALYSAAEEMKIVLAKTAYSPLLKVAGDDAQFVGFVIRGGNRRERHAHRAHEGAASPAAIGTRGHGDRVQIFPVRSSFLQAEANGLPGHSCGAGTAELVFFDGSNHRSVLK